MQIQLNHSQINLPRILLSTENLNICGNGGKYVNMIRNHGSIVWLNIIINIIIEFRSDKRTKYHPIQNSICVNFIGYFPIAVHFAPPPIEMGNIQKLFLATQENIRSGTGGKFPRCRFHTWQDFSDRVRGSKSTFHTSIILKENKLAKLRWTQNKLQLFPHFYICLCRTWQSLEDLSFRDGNWERNGI